MGRTRDRQLLHAISDAVLAILGERRPERSLRRLVESARSLVGAKYAALGIPDEGGEEFRQFIFTGMSDELVAKIGPLPRRHGLLAAMLKEASAYRTADVRQDPRFEWWPDAHPRMSSFPRRAHRLRRRGDRGALSHRQDRRAGVLRRGPGGDRDARGTRSRRDRERPPARAQPRAKRRRGTQPPGARTCTTASSKRCSASR